MRLKLILPLIFHYAFPIPLASARSDHVLEVQSLVTLAKYLWMLPLLHRFCLLLVHKEQVYGIAHDECSHCYSKT